MHEWGITQELVAEVKRRAADNRLSKVTKVQVALGAQAGLSASALRGCFRALAKDTLLSRTKLQIKKAPNGLIIVQTIEGEQIEKL